jgi:hypothetical protein
MGDVNRLSADSDGLVSVPLRNSSAEQPAARWTQGETTVLVPKPRKIINPAIAITIGLALLAILMIVMVAVKAYLKKRKERDELKNASLLLAGVPALGAAAAAAANNAVNNATNGAAVPQEVIPDGGNDAIFGPKSHIVPASPKLINNLMVVDPEKNSISPVSNRLQEQQQSIIIMLYDKDCPHVTKWAPHYARACHTISKREQLAALKNRVAWKRKMVFMSLEKRNMPAQLAHSRIVESWPTFLLYNPIDHSYNRVVEENPADLHDTICEAYDEIHITSHSITKKGASHRVNPSEVLNDNDPAFMAQLGRVASQNA